MKKILVFALCVLAWMGAKADSELNAVPFSTSAGIVENDYEQYFEVRLENAVDVAVMQFDLYLPEGMTLIADEPMELTKERWNGITKKGVFMPNATAACNDKGNGHYFITLYDEDLDVAKGNTGVAFLFYYLTSEDLADGYYPIRIEGVEMGPDGDPSHGSSIVASTSYVKIGNPTSGSLALKGQIPSFVNEALATETAITTLDLTNVTASNGTFAYVPGRDVVAPEAEVFANVSATVAPKGTTYASLCLPFNATGLNNCFTLSEVKDSYATFTEVENLDAGTAAIISGEVTATASNVALAGVAKDVKTSGYYVKNDQLVNVNGFNATIPALRGWWDMPAGVRGFVLEGEETAINAIDANEAETIYNVAGVRLNKAQRGVNIVNGKKVVIK